MADNFYTSSVIYLKLLVIWGLVMVADYFLEFRFEYLWPFWLFLRSVYDSFKYQGLAFSVFFICIAVTSDLICFLFVPVHWLFFAASTYVWVQYVWHTDKGVCLPTLFLWLLFVYIEASIRLKEFKAHLDLKNLPFQLDLGRPFAAHCIGYPVVTLGFGLKSYVGYRMRQRRQRDVQKENEYYFEYCRQALPPGAVREDAFNPQPSPKPSLDDRLSDALVMSSATSVSLSNGSATSLPSDAARRPPVSNGDVATANGDVSDAAVIVTASSSSRACNGAAVNGDADYLEKCRDDDKVGADDKRAKASSAKLKLKEGGKLPKEDVAQRLADIKRLKVDLQISRNKENELREQIISSMSSERHLKSEISNLQVEKSVLESRISSLMTARASEKAALAGLEKKLADERRQKADFQIKLESERKSKKEAANAERTANASRSEVLRLELELKAARAELSALRERSAAVEQEASGLRKSHETHGEPEVLVSALKALQEKNGQIEKSLSSETRIKMDLFSALGEAKRELSIKDGMLARKDREIMELKTKVAEVLAVMPSSSGPHPSSGGSAFAPTSLSLDLPATTDLSFTPKMPPLSALADLDDASLGCLAHELTFVPKATNGTSANGC